MGKAGQVFRRDVVFALLFGEGEQRHVVGLGEGFDGLDEGVADGGEQCRRGEEVPAVLAEEADHAEFALELGDVDVEVHAVDTFDFQGNVIAEDSGDGLRYTHGWVLVAGGRKANRPQCGHKRERLVRLPLVPSARTSSLLSESRNWHNKSCRSEAEPR